MVFIVVWKYHAAYSTNSCSGLIYVLPCLYKQAFTICISQIGAGHGISSNPICFPNQTGGIIGNMQVLLGSFSRAFVLYFTYVGLLATLALAKAAKLDDGSRYHVVKDLPGNETQESGEENVATCLDVMARNGQIFIKLSSVWVKNI